VILENKLGKKSMENWMRFRMKTIDDKIGWKKLDEKIG